MRSLCIWRLLDGKPGHESQTLGLARAMEHVAAAHGQVAEVIDVSVTAQHFSLLDFLRKRFRPGHDLPAPDFILGAGHRTHWPMLCARRRFGGKAIALMSPSLPKAWFDWVIAPAHDGVSGPNVIVTQGVLNAMQPGEKQPGKTLVLVGGESKHFVWSDAAVLAQVESVMARHPQVCLTDSRRTPAALRAELAQRWPVEYQPWEKCPPGWLANELSIAENAWVTEDSVSMIYEALTAGCAVGVLGLMSKGGAGRLVRGIEQLVKTRRVVRLQGREAPDLAAMPLPRLDEATRIATHLLTAAPNRELAL